MPLWERAGPLAVLDGLLGENASQAELFAALLDEVFASGTSGGSAAVTLRRPRRHYAALSDPDVHRRWLVTYVVLASAGGVLLIVVAVWWLVRRPASHDTPPSPLHEPPGVADLAFRRGWRPL